MNIDINDLQSALSRYRAQGILVPGKKMIKTPAQIQGIRESGKINTAILDFISEQISEGITTGDIDCLIREKTKALGGHPATLGYRGFPAAVCVSVNNEVCHGIPDPGRRLKSGDVFNIDVSTVYKGFFSDSSRMFSLDRTTKENLRLVAVAKGCMEAGIAQVRPWGRLGDVGGAVHEYAVKNGCSIVREIGGHGVGLAFHEDPFVSYVAKKGSGMVMVPGMVFTVEPMVNLGGPEVYQDNGNGWTIRTVDGKASAQWETMVLVTEEGCELLAW